MRSWAKVTLCCLLLLALERGTRLATDGFRLEKTAGAYPFNPEWEVGDTLPVAALDQSFTFLGSGVQCYAFLGDDQKTVLKLFKHHHFGLPTPTFEKIPFSQKALARRHQRMVSIFGSALLARKELPKETGVFFLQLNPSFDGTVTLYDKIGVKHTLDLSKTPFLLQRYAAPLSPSDEVDTFLSTLKEKSIAFTDTHIRRNFGKIGDQLILFDIGSFTKDSS